MEKIDTIEWREFIVGELFDISRPIARSQLTYEDGHVAFVASGNFNNGVSKWCMPKEGEVLDDGNCITVSPLDGSAFYQADSFLGRGGAGSAILMLRNVNLTELSGLFISSVIRRSLTKYTYSDQLNSNSIETEIIRLPANDSGEPDWAYMDEYMSEIMSEAETNLEHLSQTDGDKHSVDVSNWCSFIIGDLFSNFVKPAVLHTRQVVESDDGIPYVVRTKFDNGIKCRVQPVDGVKPSPAGVITWGAENATFFYQTEPFLSGRDIYFIDTREYSPMTCLFLTSCLQTITHKYPYNFGLFPDLLKRERIKLPVDASGEPDWAYMDKYMRAVMESAKFNLSVMQSI